MFMRFQPHDSGGPRIREIPIRMVLPNLITVLAICAGLSGIRLAFEHRFETAVVMVLIAAFLDGIDGRVARLFKASSKFGAQMDSLADIVNFGVAPALVLYAFLLDRAGSPGWIAALLFVIACGLRLARFNVLDDDLERPAWQAEYFVGVPAPAGAGLVLLPTYIGFMGVEPERPLVYASIVYTVLIALLLISRLPVYSGKTIRQRISTDWVIPLIFGAGVLRADFDHISLADAVGLGAGLSRLPAAQRPRLHAPRQAGGGEGGGARVGVAGTALAFAELIRAPLPENDHGFDLEEHLVNCKLGNGNQRLRRQRLAEHFLDGLGQHLKLGHIVIDHEDRELGDLIRPGAERIEGGAQICVGLLNLDSEVGRQRSRAVLAALSGDVGHPARRWARSPPCCSHSATGRRGFVD